MSMSRKSSSSCIDCCMKLRILVASKNESSIVNRHKCINSTCKSEQACKTMFYISGMMCLPPMCSLAPSLKLEKCKCVVGKTDLGWDRKDRYTFYMGRTISSSSWSWSSIHGLLVGPHLVASPRHLSCTESGSCRAPGQPCNVGHVRFGLDARRCWHRLIDPLRRQAASPHPDLLSVSGVEEEARWGRGAREQGAPTSPINRITLTTVVGGLVLQGPAAAAAAASAAAAVHIPAAARCVHSRLAPLPCA